MNIFKLLMLTLSLFVVGCSDDGSPTASSVTFVEGTYSLSDVTMYDNSDCSGTGMTGMCENGVSTTEAECDGMWISFSDMITDDDAMEIVFSGGIFTAPEDEEGEEGDDGETGTYTIDGTVITIIDGDEIRTGTINADGTLSMENSNSAGCFDDYDNEVEGANEDTCEGYWEEASCFIMIFNLVAS